MILERAAAASEPLADYWRRQGNWRNHLLIVMAANTGLRGIDYYLRLRWEDVFDAERGEFRPHVVLDGKKSRKQKTVIAISERLLEALQLCMRERRGDYVFANNRKKPGRISKACGWRIIREAAKAIRDSARRPGPKRRAGG